MFFDQLNISFTKGNLKEENHYYPHGLPITTLSSQAEGLQEQRRKYQSNEYIKDLGLNWMDFQARQYDPQTGRFLGVDPLAGKGGQSKWSPYAAMGNAPEVMIDPNGTFAYVNNYFNSKTEAQSVMTDMFGAGNFSIAADGMITILNPAAAQRHFNAFIASGAGGISAAAAVLFRNIGDAILAHHNDPHMDVQFNVVYNTVGEMSWHMSVPEVAISGSDGTYNVVQAACRNIGYNAYARQRADWASNMVMGWMYIGAAPFAVIAAAEAAPLIPALGLRAANSYLSNPAAWNEAAAGALYGAAGYGAESPTAGAAGAAGAAARAEAVVVEEAAEVATKFSVASSKFDYFFGKVITGSEHNIARSAQNLKDLTTLGITTENQLTEVFSQALESGAVISTKASQFGTTVTRNVTVGSAGSINVGFFYEGGNMNSVPIVTTIIPKIYK